MPLEKVPIKSQMLKTIIFWTTCIIRSHSRWFLGSSNHIPDDIWIIQSAQRGLILTGWITCWLDTGYHTPKIIHPHLVSNRHNLFCTCLQLYYSFSLYVYQYKTCYLNINGADIDNEPWKETQFIVSFCLVHFTTDLVSF